MYFKLLFVLGLLLNGCVKTESSKEKVVGGSAASQDYQFFASLAGEDYSIYCGGSFIADNVVLTAAHCVHWQSEKLFVAQGLSSTEQMNDSNARKVKAVVVHEDYDPNAMTNDIALLFLEDSGVSNSNPIPMGTESSFVDGNPLKVIGFGNTSSFGYLYIDQLMEVEIPSISVSHCQQLLPESDISEKQICTQLSGGSIDSCQGDSGGPLFTEKDGEFVLEGIVSWGYGCAQKDLPGVYVRVSQYRSWIDSKISMIQSNSEVSEKELVEIVNSYCFEEAKKVFSNEFSEGYIEEKLTMRLDNLQSITAKQAASPSSVISSCSIPSSGGSKITVEYINSSAFEYSAYVSAGDKLYRASLEKEEKLSISCNDTYFYVDASSGSLYFDGVDYEGVADVAQQPAEQSLTNCTSDGVQASIFPSDSGYVVTMKGRFAEPMNFLVEKYQEPALKVTVKNGENGESFTQFSNTTETDVYTWRLTCPFDYSLTDVMNVVHQSTDGTIKFDHAKDKNNGTIMNGHSVSYTMSQGADKLDMCTLNGLDLQL